MMLKSTTEWHLKSHCVEDLEEELISRGFFAYAIEHKTDETRVILYTEDEDFVRDLLKRTDSEVVEKKSSRVDDWFRYMKLEPFEIADGIWVDPTSRLKLRNAVVVKMKPSAAFGTGDHPTTLLAARLLIQYLKNTYSVLDVGCGTAILAIIAAKLGARKVTALDNDPVAVEVAKEFVKKNRVKVDVILSDLLSNITGRYDLVVANILTPVIIELIDQVDRVTNAGSTLIVSGIPAKDETVVKRHLRSRNFEIMSEGEMQNWKAFAVKIC